MAKIEWNVTVLPTAEIIGVCAECRAEVARVPYNGYHDYNYKLAKLKKQLPECPKCRKPVDGAVSGKPKWKRTESGDWIAECVDGDFLIWKYGYAYKWRYRTYGRQEGDYYGNSATLEEAKSRCERQKEFKKGA